MRVTIDLGLVVTPSRLGISTRVRALTAGPSIALNRRMRDEAPDTVRCPPRFGETGAAMSGTVLLVEDDERLARCLSRLMKANGYEVVHANTGEAALESVRTRSFDVVLSDLNLPDSCGVDILRLARAHDPDVPLLLMSGDPTVTTTIDALNLGVLEYLVKPLTSDQLARVLRRATSVRMGQPRPLFGEGAIVKLWPEFDEIDQED